MCDEFSTLNVNIFMRFIDYMLKRSDEKCASEPAFLFKTLGICKVELSIKLRMKSCLAGGSSNKFV